MSFGLERAYKFKPLKQLTLTANATPSPGNVSGTNDFEIIYQNLSGGMVYIPLGSPITQLTFWCAPRPSNEQDPNTPFQNPQPAQTVYKLSSPNNPLTVVAGSCYQVPTEAFGAGSLFIIASAGGVGQVEFSAKG